MPTPTEILQVLAAISNQQLKPAIFWHAVMAITVIGIVIGWRPIRKAGAMALALPFLSVSIMAWAYRNPFNGAVFLLAAIAVLAFGLRQAAEKVDRAPVWATVAGSLMIVFGWVYPHFLEGGSWLRYLYESPAGLIPCPTLSVVTGFALLANGFSSRALSVMLGMLGLFYALFGAFRLGVRIDLILMLGAAALLTLALRPGFSAPERKPSSESPRPGPG
jgi:hypothetical protein